MKHTLLGGSSPNAFAHLLGLAGKKSKAEDSDDDRKEDAAAAEDDTDSDDEKQDDKSAKGKKAKKAEDSDADDETMDTEDGDDAEDDKKDTKKSKAPRSEADDDEECEDDDDYAKGRKAERARWAKVLKSPAAAEGRLPSACALLTGTSMSSDAIVTLLETLPAAAKRGGLAERMAGAKIPNVGSGEASGDKPSLAAQIVAAGKIRRGEK